MTAPNIPAARRVFVLPAATAVKTARATLPAAPKTPQAPALPLQVLHRSAVVLLPHLAQHQRPPLQVEARVLALRRALRALRAAVQALLAPQVLLPVMPTPGSRMPSHMPLVAWSLLL